MTNKVTDRKLLVGNKDSITFKPHPSTKKAWEEAKKNKKRGTK